MQSEAGYVPPSLLEGELFAAALSPLPTPPPPPPPASPPPAGLPSAEMAWAADSRRSASPPPLLRTAQPAANTAQGVFTAHLNERLLPFGIDEAQVSPAVAFVRRQCAPARPIRAAAD